MLLVQVASNTIASSSLGHKWASLARPFSSKPAGNGIIGIDLGTTNSSVAVMEGKNEVLSLFRSLLRTAGIFSDYNIREYAKRRTINGFRQNRRLSDPSSIASAFYDGKSQLKVTENRQLYIHRMPQNQRA
eukprot:TRINITY_DN784_c0_g1_i8.p1 TRINITY_DN784_c0_g1~~TRINITY_DN784_c0_g1_i8.p1  ORF type:complete len:131 (+),score=27.30 TRINITY_DN784_c0_g1_i8:691-1083(+)